MQWKPYCRYFAILHPLKSRINKSKSRTMKIIVMTYVIPALASLPFLYPKAEATENTLHSVYGTISRLTCFINFDPIHPQFRKGYYTFLFITFYVVPLAFIAFTCFCIARSLFRITTLSRQGSLRRQETNRRKVSLNWRNISEFQLTDLAPKHEQQELFVIYIDFRAPSQTLLSQTIPHPFANFLKPNPL